MTAPRPGPWVVRLPSWLAALVEQVPYQERARRLEQHCAKRGTKDYVCDYASEWVNRAETAWSDWSEDALQALADGLPAPPHPLAEVMPRVPLGRLSPEVKAELARRAAWAGVRTEDYACGVILSASDA